MEHILIDTTELESYDCLEDDPTLWELTCEEYMPEVYGHVILQDCGLSPREFKKLLHHNGIRIEVLTDLEWWLEWCDAYLKNYYPGIYTCTDKLIESYVNRGVQKVFVLHNKET